LDQLRRYKMQLFKSGLFMTVVLTFLLFLSVTSVLLVEDAQAYVRGMSRANCFGRNESITWNAPWINNYYWTNSYHCPNFGSYYNHSLTTGWLYSNWATAGDWDWTYNWRVVGDHWYWTAATGTRYVGRTNTTWCSAFSW
jgi:hypothetical protein